MRTTILLLAFLVGVCQGSEELDANPDIEIGVSTGRAPLTLLDMSTGAACLDGTPYGFYHVPSKTNSTLWTISIQGGGWCYNETLCYERSLTRLGSSKFFPTTSSCGCVNVENGDIDRDCNCIYMPYGDGASFSGLREDPWPAPGNKKLYFRGWKNLEATLDYAFQKLGMAKATQVVLTGGSAGGLSTFLHADYVAERVRKEAPLAFTKAMPVVGYFLDHKNFAGTSQSYPAWMDYIYHMQNLKIPALTSECLKAYPSTPYYCFMSPHMHTFIQTPFYMLNSKFDQWQMDNILQVSCMREKSACTDSEKAAIVAYGKSFMADFNSVMQNEKNGAMITSCICHGCNWNNITLNGKNTYSHYIDWFESRGSNHFTIDPMGPNGDGKMNLKANNCQQIL